MTPALTAYRLAAGLLEPWASTVLRRRADAGKEDAGRLCERLGRPSAERPAGSLIWLHGASVGECVSLLPLIDGLRASAFGGSLLMTTGTVGAAQLMASRLPTEVIHQYAPLDLPKAATGFLSHWKPTLTIFVESEIWPNLISLAKARRSSMALLSARLSEKSLKGWTRVPASARRVFGSFDLVMSQDERTASGLRALGARDDGRLNLKRAAAPLPVDLERLADLKARARGRPVLLAASTHPGEDEIVLGAFASLSSPDAQLVIVPRHPRRAGEIERLSQALGLAASVRSRGEAFGATPVYVADTLGELGLWFSLCRGAFIGGSLLAGPGGHNPLEAVQLDCAVAAGPHLDNWRETYQRLVSRGGVAVVRDQVALGAAFDAFLTRPEETQAQARRARAVDEDSAAELAQAIDRLRSLMP
jgi:3-deoxy-D-manno-octulosonic-acid transferase